MLNKRFEARYPFEKECSLLKKESGVIEAMIIDVAKQGLGIRTNHDASFKKGDSLFVSIACLQYSSQAKVQWINKGAKRLGLNLFSSLYR